MSDMANPWRSPEAEAAEESAPQGVLTLAMIRYLKGAAPWLVFLGVLGYIGAAVLGLLGLILLGAAVVGDTVFGRGFMGTLASALGGPLHLAMGGLVFFPARFTHGFGVKIRRYMASGAERDLEEALRNNRSLWKFTGILAIVYLAFIPLGIIAAVIAVISSAF
jgi:hypothetical protein